MRLRRVLVNVSIPLLAIAFGLFVSTIFVSFAQSDPLETYSHLFCEGFGPTGCQTFGNLFFMDIQAEDGSSHTVFSPLYGENGHRLAIVLERATPLILTALSAAVAFQAGMFSIGMDGQLVLGAIVAVFLGYWIPDQVYAAAGIADPEAAPQGLLTVMHFIIPAICIAAAMAAGAFYSWIAGYLKVRLNVNELISTIILNTIAVRLVGYLINFPMRADFQTIARTRAIDDTAWLVPFNRGILPEVEWFSGSRVGIGFILALLVAALVAMFLWRTTAGYEQRMARGSRLFARFGGIPSEKAALRAMLISGALSGLAGAIEILGVHRRVVDGFASTGTGFDGVLVAILARESIPGIILVACFFAGLGQGAVNLQFGNLPRQLGGIIFSFIVLFSAMESFFRETLARLRGTTQPAPQPEAAEVSGGAAN